MSPSHRPNEQFRIPPEQEANLWKPMSYAEEELAKENIPISAIYAPLDESVDSAPLRSIKVEYLNKQTIENILNSPAFQNLQSSDARVFFENLAIVAKEWKSSFVFEYFINLQNEILVPQLANFIKTWDGVVPPGESLKEIFEYAGICTARKVENAAIDLIKKSDLTDPETQDANEKNKLDLAKAFYQRSNNLERYRLGTYRTDSLLPAFVRDRAEKEVPSTNSMITLAETEEHKNLKLLQELAIGNPKGDGMWSRVLHYVTFGASTSSIVGIFGIVPPQFQPVVGIIAFGFEAYSLKQLIPKRVAKIEESEAEPEEKLHSFPVRYSAASALSSLLHNPEVGSNKKWVAEKTLIYMIQDKSLRVSERLQVAQLLKAKLTTTGLNTLLDRFEHGDEETQVVCGFALVGQPKDKIQKVVDRVTLGKSEHMREALSAIRAAQNK